MPAPSLIAKKLLTNYPIISDQVSRATLLVVLGELEKTLHAEINGDVAEFGCYSGTTSLFIKRLLNAYSPGVSKNFYAYDSFQGLPNKLAHDYSGTGEQFRGGELRVSKKQFLQNFHKAHLIPPVTHAAWFSDLQTNQLPDKLSFAFLDGDFYESIWQCLQLVWPRLQPGGIITIDDYQRDALPGVERAVTEFFRNKPVQIYRQQHIAIIRPGS